MNFANTTKLASLLAFASAALATGCNAHPIKDVEMQSFGDGISLEDGGGSGDAGEDDGDDQGDGEGEGDGDADGGDDVPPRAGDDGGDGEETPTCETQTIDVSANPPEVMLLLDKSGSMTSNSWNYDGANVTRWSSLHSVTNDVLTTYDESMNFGALLFPAIDADGGGNFDQACRLGDSANVATGPGNANAILGAIPGQDDDTSGATPTRAAVELATAELAAVQTEGARAMVLITDGRANCINPDDAGDFDAGVPNAVGNALAQQIPTYVIGIDLQANSDGVDTREAMDDVARAGGVVANTDPDLPAFYDAADADGLYDALDEIAARVECTIPLAEAALEDAVVSIAVDGEDIAEITDCASEDGWHFTDAEARNQVELCNAACDALRVTGTVETTQCEDDSSTGPIIPIP